MQNLHSLLRSSSIWNSLGPISPFSSYELHRRQIHSVLFVFHVPLWLEQAAHFDFSYQTLLYLSAVTDQLININTRLKIAFFQIAKCICLHKLQNLSSDSPPLSSVQLSAVTDQIINITPQKAGNCKSGEDYEYNNDQSAKIMTIWIIKWG